MKLCNKCHVRPALKSGKDKDGNQKYHAVCGKCRYEQDGKLKTYSYDNKTKYRLFTGMICTKCGFEAEDICQMDGHHIDGNHANNEEENIQTLCTNCHRLVHFLAKKTPR